MKGKFVVIEGGEGSGKTSVINFLREAFDNCNDIVFTREPGGTNIGEKIRTVLMDKTNNKMTVLTELFLFCGVRAQHISELIIPSLKVGKHVISDRFDASTIAYQLFGRNRFEMLHSFLTLNNIAKQEVEPDAVIWLDVSPEIGLSRKEKSQEGKSTRFDEEKIEFHRRVREGFESCFKKNNIDSPISSVWYRIDTDNISLDNVRKEILNLIEKIGILNS